MKVEDVMTRDVATVSADATLKDVAHLLVDKGVSGLPVVDEDGRVVGVVSEADVLAKERHEPERGGALARLLHRDDAADDLKLEARLARDAMSAPVIVAEPHWSIASAADRMLDHRINRLPVIKHDRLVGIVTRADLVRAFARSDDDLACEIREVVDFQKALWNDQADIDVRVDAGEAVLAGTMRSRSYAEMLAKIVRNVPGVVGVRDELSWTEDE
jgi:CBS domain-containing protein